MPRQQNGINKLIKIEILKEPTTWVGCINMVMMRIRTIEKPVNCLLKPRVPTLHLVFEGNPETGKNSVARLIGQIYFVAGIFSKGQLVKVHCQDFVSPLRGEPMLKMKQKIEEAIPNMNSGFRSRFSNIINFPITHLTSCLVCS